MFVDVDDCARIVEIRRCYVSTVGVHLAERIGRERLWKVESMAVGMMGATIATGVARRVFVTVRKDKAPDSIFDPTSSRFSWPDVVAWAAAAGVGLGVAKVFSARVAAIGWKLATGTPPPGTDEPPG